MKHISVVVCCHNSEHRIAETIRHLALQEVSDDVDWEVILVNNASIDNTSSVAHLTWQKYYHGSRAQFRVINEEQAGLMHARNAGINNAQAEIIIFCDDDNHLTQNYLAQAWFILDKYPDVGIVGGLAHPKFSTKTEPWLKDLYSSLALGPQASAEGYVSWVYGAGMVIRKKVFLDLKNRNIQLMLSDRVGTKQTSGGDSEICLLAGYLNYKIYYSPGLELFHAIGSHRLTQRSFIKANYRNVFPIVHLSLLQALIAEPAPSVGRLYILLWKKSLSNAFYFMPRSLLGKHRFYSFLMLYQNIQLLFWALLNRSAFNQTYFRIKNNLSHE